MAASLPDVRPPRRRALSRPDLMLLRRCESIRLGDVLRATTPRGRIAIIYNQTVGLRRGYRIEMNGALVCTIIGDREKSAEQERTLPARLAAWCKTRRYNLYDAQLDFGAAADDMLEVKRPVVPPPLCINE